MKTPINGVPQGTFSDRVKKVVANIPHGSVMTYRQVAQKAGSAWAARAVGTVMRQNYDRNVPCHRVVLNNGELGAYNRGGTQQKEALLKAEGVSVVNGRVEIKRR